MDYAMVSGVPPKRFRQHHSDTAHFSQEAQVAAEQKLRRTIANSFIDAGQQRGFDRGHVQFPTSCMTRLHWQGREDPRQSEVYRRRQEPNAF